MQKLPHEYTVKAEATDVSNITITAGTLTPIESAPPIQYGGPGDIWSPEDLLVASVSDCFILTFRAIARASKLEWASLTCETVGVLDKVERVTQFVELQIKATLRVPTGTDMGKAERLLEKAENGCLITNSLTAKKTLTVQVLEA